MFHLEASIHFQEVELARRVVVEKLHGPGRAILHGLPEPYRGISKPRSNFRCDARRGGLFQHLLVAALSGAVALAQRDHAASSIAEKLYLDVAGPRDRPFEEHAGVAEVRAAQTRDHIERTRQLFRGPAQPHPDAAAARGALEHDRVADMFRASWRR